MAELSTVIGALLLIGSVWLILGSSTPGAAQSPTPAATLVSPGVSTVRPSQVIVTPMTNVAESTTASLTQGGDGGSFSVTTGVIAGLAAAGAVLFAGIAYRLARGRPRAG